MTLQSTDTLTLTVTETDRLGQFTILAVAVNGVYRDVARFANEGMTCALGSVYPFPTLG